MLDSALKLLKEITEHSYKAYIVGGFVRDYLLGIESSDIDICTNATPKEIKEIFSDSCLPNEDYGSVIVTKNGIRFEITTFRREIEYNDKRRPIEIKYIDDLYEDLLRRDFSINAICMDKDGRILDYLGGKEDLNNHIIKSIGIASDKFTEDPLRILRAIRFSTILNFNLDEEVISSIKETKYLLKNLSYNRKKEELDKIFTSPNYKNGIKLLLELGLDKELEINNLNKVLNSISTNSIGIWSILNVCDNYPFNKNELELIDNINKVLKLDVFDKKVLYKYGLYVCSVACEIKNLDNKKIIEDYNNLVIKSRDDIDIDADTIMNLLKKSPGKYLKEIYDDLEENILNGNIENNKDIISNYIINKY